MTAVLLTFVLLSLTPALAHKIRIFAWETGDGTISTEAKFSGGRPAQKSPVKVIDTKTGHQVAGGETNEEGIFTFPIPNNTSGNLQIIVDTGDGHKNTWNHTISAQHTSVSTSSETQPEIGSKASVSSIQPPDNIATLSSYSCNKEELTTLLETALDKKLAPLRKSLAESADQGPTLQDIFGGIGYILGLAGMAAYIQARRQNRRKE